MQISAPTQIVSLAVVMIAVSLVPQAYPQESSTTRDNAAELDANDRAALDELATAARSSEAVQALLKKQLQVPSSGVSGKILSMEPCNVSTFADPTDVEVTAELRVGAQEPRPKLFVIYLVLQNTSTHQYYLKRSQSYLLAPGSAICVIVSDEIWNLPPGKYRLAAQPRTANSDGSETILNPPTTCNFDKVLPPS